MKTMIAAWCLSFGLLTAGGEPVDGTELRPRELKVLMIGNSFSICVGRQMPQVVASMGLKLDLASLYIGGCPLSIHWRNWAAGVTNVTLKPYRFDRYVDGRRIVENGKANIPDAVALADWDIVTFQQASYESWRSDTYRPWADDLQSAIRKHLPKAEFVWQETWSYCPFDGRLKQWKITSDEMYARLCAAYSDIASAKRQRQIPTGAAVDLFRRRLPVVYGPTSNGGDVVGSPVFENGAVKGDVCHLNRRGEYLQALVWTAKLFGVDVRTCPYKPDFVTAEEAALMKDVAMTSVGAQVVFEEPGWCVWCPSAVALPDGRYALVHSRWRESAGFEAWCAKSEAALAVSETGPLGPYKSVGTILKGSGRNGDFDRDVVHNPSVFADGGKYYLFYMGTYSDAADGLTAGASSSGTAKGSFRMNQRIGVAVADRVEGPYVRSGRSILPETEDCIMASNPAVVRMPNGKYLMVYKWGWPPAARYPICRNSCAAAIADSPLGPWKVVSKDIFPVRGANFPGEDPCLWLEGDVICCSIHDNGHFYSSSDRALIKFESRDGLDWANCGELFPRGRIDRLERPFVLTEPEGKHLLFAASKPDARSSHSEILAFPGVLPEPERIFDLVIYGGTSAGLAAAVAAKRSGLEDVVVLEPTGRIGGLTTGGLGQTDIGVKWAFGGIAREFYHDIRSYYNDASHWIWQKKDKYKSKGQSETSDNEDTMWTFEPSAALTVLEGWERRDGLDIRRGERLDREKGVGVEEKGGQRRIVSIRTLSGKVFRSKMFVDATYEGDLMAAAGVSYAVGREDNSVYGETINGVQAEWHPATFPKEWDNQIHVPVDPYVVPGNKSSGLIRGVEPEGREAPNGSGDHRVQAYCFRICMTDCPENRIPFKKPADYDERDYELLFRMAEAGEDLAVVNFAPMPNRKTDSNNRGGFSMDFIGGNWNYPEASYAERDRIVRAHLRYQQGLLWTLANHPRIPVAVRNLYSCWGTCKDEFKDGFGDGWQSQLYVREARRMVGDYVMTERDCRQVRKVPRPVALAAYGMDSHNVRRHVVDGKVRNEGDVQDHEFKRPYPVEYGSIVPKKAECANLFVPVCVSASHIAYGSIRMEPVFFALGQVVGTAAAQAIAEGLPVQEVDYMRLRRALESDGQVLKVRE